MQACKCGGYLLGFGSCRANGAGSEGGWVSACRPGRAVGGVRVGLAGARWMQCSWSGGCGILEEGAVFIVHLLTWRGPSKGCPSSSVGLGGGESWCTNGGGGVKMRCVGGWCWVHCSL